MKKFIKVLEIYFMRLILSVSMRMSLAKPLGTSLIH